MEADIDNYSNLGSAKIFSVLCLGNSHELNPPLVRFSNALPSPISARYPYMVSGMNVSYRVCYVICIFVGWLLIRALFSINELFTGQLFIINAVVIRKLVPINAVAICRQICQMFPRIRELYLMRAISDRYFWLSEPSLPDTLVISGQFGLVMPDIRIIRLKRALSTPDMLFILHVYASYLAGDNRNNKSRVAYNAHRNSREYWVTRRSLSCCRSIYN